MPISLPLSRHIHLSLHSSFFLHTQRSLCIYLYLYISLYLSSYRNISIKRPVYGCARRWIKRAWLAALDWQPWRWSGSGSGESGHEGTGAVRGVRGGGRGPVPLSALQHRLVSEGRAGGSGGTARYRSVSERRAGARRYRGLGVPPHCQARFSRRSPRSCSVPCCRTHRGECGPGGTGANRG